MAKKKEEVTEEPGEEKSTEEPVKTEETKIRVKPGFRFRLAHAPKEGVCNTGILYKGKSVDIKLTDQVFELTDEHTGGEHPYAFTQALLANGFEEIKKEIKEGG